MLAGTSDPDSAGTQARGRPAWKVQLPLVLAVVALAALVVVPWLVDRRIEDLRMVREEAGEPALLLASRIRIDLVAQIAAIRGFLLTGDAQFVEHYRAALAREAQAYAELLPHLERFSPELLARLARLQEAATDWRGPHGAVLAGELTADEYLEFAEEQQRAYAEAQAAAADLETGILHALDELREAARHAESVGLWVTVGLVALAFLTMIVLVRLGTRLGRRVRREQELRERLQELMAGRSRLVRGLSHDLKNPLGAADGFAELMETEVPGPLTDQQRDAVSRIRRSIGNALALLDELHEFARAERGQLEIRPEPVDLAALVRDVAGQHAAGAEMAGLEFQVRTGSVPAVRTDPARVRQILSNLLSNAIKYTPRGGTVEVALRSSSDAPPAPGSGGWIMVEVQDTGPGIPAQEKEHVFTEFSRLRAGVERGAGLGLAISRSIARQMGGDVTLDSEVGAGSTFILLLPLGGATTGS